MKIKINLKKVLFLLIIFLLPFIDFLKNNLNEIDIILGKSFYFLGFIVFLSLFILTLTINLFLYNKDLTKIFLIVVVIYWLAFKHNSLKLVVYSFLNNFFLFANEFSSEISLLILIILSTYASILIYKNNLFFKKFIFVFFYITFFVSLFQIFNFNQKSNINKLDKNLVTI